MTAKMIAMTTSPMVEASSGQDTSDSWILRVGSSGGALGGSTVVVVMAISLRRTAGGWGGCSGHSRGFSNSSNGAGKASSASWALSLVTTATGAVTFAGSSSPAAAFSQACTPISPIA